MVTAVFICDKQWQRAEDCLFVLIVRSRLSFALRSPGDYFRITVSHTRVGYSYENNP